jgi:hypothetical protein
MSIPGYREYAGSPADFVGDGQAGSYLRIVQGVILTVWTAGSGGMQVINLRDASGTPTDVVETDSFGNFRFYAADDLGTLWVSTSAQGSGTRYAVQASDSTSRIRVTEQQIASLPAQIDDAIGHRIDDLRGEGLIFGGDGWVTGFPVLNPSSPDFAATVAAMPLGAVVVVDPGA